MYCYGCTNITNTCSITVESWKANFQKLADAQLIKKKTKIFACTWFCAYDNKRERDKWHLKLKIKYVNFHTKKIVTTLYISSTEYLNLLCEISKTFLRNMS